MDEYWIISLPSSSNVELLNHETDGLSENYHLEMPTLKVKSLDQLVAAMDDLEAMDLSISRLIVRLCKYFRRLTFDSPLSSNVATICEKKDIETYLTNFSWDIAKYSTKQSIASIMMTINKQVLQVEEEFSTKSKFYDNLKKDTSKMSRNFDSGSLLSRNLGKLISREHFVMGSEYLTTLLVVVPRNLFEDWFSSYETLTDLVVPRSSTIVTADFENGVHTVTLFKRKVNEFMEEAKKRNFIVRPFDLDVSHNELDKLRKSSAEVQQLFKPLVVWMKVNIVQAFKTLVHVKVLQVFVESVLRYGLPITFKVVLMKPSKKTERKLRAVLEKLFSGLDRYYEPHMGQGAVSIPVGLSFNPAEYYPYVYNKMDIKKIFDLKI